MFKYILRIFGVFSFLLIGQRNLIAIMQAETLTEQVYLFRDYQVTAIDPQTGVQSTLLQLDSALETFSATAPQEAARIFSANISPDGRYSYVLEATGRDEFGLPTMTELVRLDMTRGERYSLISRSGIFNYSISPDQTYIIVIYYEGEFARSRQRACILNVSSRVCDQIPSVQVAGTPAYFLNNQEFMIYTFEDVHIKLVNVVTQQITSIPTPAELFVYSAVPIPNTRMLLLSAVSRNPAFVPSSFYTLNLDSLQTTELAYDALNFEEYPGIGTWQFSPDGRFLSYSGGLSTAIIEFSSGILIREIETVVSSGWLDNDTMLFQGSLDGTTLVIDRLEALTGETTQLLSGAAAEGILLVP